jgi:hypothetical protein
LASPRGRPARTGISPLARLTSVSGRSPRFCRGRRLPLRPAPSTIRSFGFAQGCLAGYAGGVLRGIAGGLRRRALCDTGGQAYGMTMPPMMMWMPMFSLFRLCGVRSLGPSVPGKGRPVARAITSTQGEPGRSGFISGCRSRGPAAPVSVICAWDGRFGVGPGGAVTRATVATTSVTRWVWWVRSRAPVFGGAMVTAVRSCIWSGSMAVPGDYPPGGPVPMCSLELILPKHARGRRGVSHSPVTTGPLFQLVRHQRKYAGFHQGVVQGTSTRTGSPGPPRRQEPTCA